MMDEWEICLYTTIPSLQQSVPMLVWYVVECMGIIKQHQQWYQEPTRGYHDHNTNQILNFGSSNYQETSMLLIHNVGTSFLLLEIPDPLNPMVC